MWGLTAAQTLQRDGEERACDGDQGEVTHSYGRWDGKGTGDAGDAVTCHHAASGQGMGSDGMDEEEMHDDEQEKGSDGEGTGGGGAGRIDGDRVRATGEEGRTAYGWVTAPGAHHGEETRLCDQVNGSVARDEGESGAGRPYEAIVTVWPAEDGKREEATATVGPAAGTHALTPRREGVVDRRSHGHPVAVSPAGLGPAGKTSTGKAAGATLALVSPRGFRVVAHNLW